MALVLSVQSLNLSGSPQRTDDEGTYVAQAWAVSNWGELAHYTYWYDHPPLGWIQLAAYARITGAFSRWDLSVMAGREAMLVAFAVTALLLWLLARRLKLSRPASALAVALFGLSPLAVTFHRTVYLDNVGIPWLLGAILLALSRRRQLIGFAGSAACFGITVLTKETFLLVLPFVAWTMWRQANLSTRRYTLAVAACVLILIGSSYVLLAALKGEVFPGLKRVSLLEGIQFQLVSRGSGGSILESGTDNNRTFMMWWQQDPLIFPAAACGALFALFIKRVRVFAVMLLFLLAVILRPSGYLPIPYVIIIFPFTALLLASVGDEFIKRLLTWKPGKVGMRLAASLCVVVAVATVGAHWSRGLAYVTREEVDKPTVQAQRWVLANVPRDQRLIVDDTMWVDMIRGGFARENVLWFYKLDSDPAVQAQSPHGWKDSDYVISTVAMRGALKPEIEHALRNSEVVAVFGGREGGLRVEVRRIHPEGIDAFRQKTESTREVSARLGKRLANDSRFHLAPQVRTAFEAGTVDPRILIALTQTPNTATLAVDSLPTVPGEEYIDPHRFEISTVNGERLLPGTPAAGAVRDWASNLRRPLQVSAIEETPDGVTISFPFPEPTYMPTK